MKITRYRPRLQTLLLLVNLLVLLLPLGGIAILRLYESELVRQTESALISQGALLAAMFRQEMLRQFDDTSNDNQAQPHFGNPVLPHLLQLYENPLTPIPPRLDVAKEAILRPAVEAAAPSSFPNQLAVVAGERLTQVIVSAKRITLAGIRLVDHQGIVVATSGTELGLSLANREEVKRALQGEHVSLLRQRISDQPRPTFDSISRRARLRVFVAFPVIDRDRVLGAVVLSRSPLDVGTGLYLIRSKLLKVGTVLLFVVLLVSIMTTMKISRPIKALISQARQVRRGEKGAAVPLESPGTQEVAQLSEAIAQMAFTLEKRAEYIRTFANSVSHEFKTPLTSLKGTIELFEDHMEGLSADEKKHFLSNMAGDIDRLDRLVKRLLELARADVIKPGRDTTDVRKTLLQLEQRYQKENQPVTVECGPGLPAIAMGPETFETIVANMVNNSLQHGGPGTRVAVKAALLSAEKNQEVEIRIQDNGKGISAANSEKIFTPFFTTAREHGGSGLGLSIVKSLVAAHNGSVESRPSKQGAAFIIILPGRD